MNAPREVKEYLANGSRHAVSVRPENSTSIIVNYEDGATRRKDMTDEMTGVMACLKDETVFATVHIRRPSGIAWDTPYGEIDIDADSVYIYGEKIEDPDPMKFHLFARS